MERKRRKRRRRRRRKKKKKKKKKEKKKKKNKKKKNTDRLLDFFKTFYATAATEVSMSLTKSKGFNSVCTVSCALFCFHYCSNDRS